MRKTAIAAIILAATCIFGCKSPEAALSFDGASDIGDVKSEGVMSYDSATDTYTLTAAGVNLWNETDAFYFVWKKVTGDFVITGDIAFEGEGVNPHRKLGFMIRESLDPSSKYADIAVHGEGLTSLQYRAENGAITEESTSESWGPDAIRLERKGNVIAVRTGKGSLPETDDTSIVLEFPAECYVGMYMCSHEDDVRETGYIKNVKLTQN